jgi:hypothetical protein
MNDDLTLLASAYLDGDVTEQERARVEGDGELLAEVERLRTVRLLLGDVEPPAISVREAQLAAALGVWDRLPETERTGARRDITPAGIDAAALAGAASVTAPTPINHRRRHTSTRWLTGAAAGLVLVLAGGIALQLSSDADTDDSSSAELSSTDADSAADSEAGTEAADAPAGADGPSTSEFTAADAAPPDVAAELDTGVADPAPPGENAGLDRLENLTDLADFAAAAVGAPRAPDEVPAATSAASDEAEESATALAEAALPFCLGVDVIVGPAVYGDVQVVVGIDEGRDLAIAYLAPSCDEVARVRLP